MSNWIDNWDYFMTKDKQFLYHRQENNIWHRHLQKPHSHRNYYILYMVLNDPPDDELDRVSIKQYATAITLVASSVKTETEVIQPQIGHVFGEISITVPKIDWFMRHISSSYTTDRLWNNILEGKAYAVSDGSYFPTTSTGACAWIVATSDGTQWIKGGGLIP